MQNLRLDLRIDQETRERLDRLAKELRADRSSLIRLLIANAQLQELKNHLAKLPQLEGADINNPQKVQA